MPTCLRRLSWLPNNTYGRKPKSSSGHNNAGTPEAVAPAGPWVIGSGLSGRWYKTSAMPSCAGTFGNRSQPRLATDSMSRPAQNVEICVHKADGTVERFVQNEADLANSILNGFQPGRIFDQEKIIIADSN